VELEILFTYMTHKTYFFLKKNVYLKNWLVFVCLVYKSIEVFEGQTNEACLNLLNNIKVFIFSLTRIKMSTSKRLLSL
jgi:hypothetical protein